MSDDRPKRRKPTITHTDTCKWIKTGQTKKGGDFINWQMGSLYCKDGETPVYCNIKCFSIRSDVIRLMPNVAEDQTKVTVRGEAGIDSWKGKLSLSIFVTKAWIGEVEDEPADGVDLIAAANRTTVLPKDDLDDNAIPF